MKAIKWGLGLAYPPTYLEPTYHGRPWLKPFNIVSNSMVNQSMSAYVQYVQRPREYNQNDVNICLG